MTIPSIILVAPQMGENIGATARSMKNFGLHDLRIVSPRDGWPNPKAVDMAKHAKDIINNAIVVDNIKDALSDIDMLYATTARPRDMAKEEITPHALATRIQSTPCKSAIMFGAERTGLSNDDIALANAIVSIPTSENYTSLNLAQAVTVVCYQYLVVSKEHHDATLHLGDSSPATKEQMVGFFEQLEAALDASDFFRVQNKRPGMIRNIRNMFSRNLFTDQDIRTLRGIIRALDGKNRSDT